MNEFPPYEALEFFIGLRVSNVIFQPYSVDFTFDDGTRLVCEHNVEHCDTAGRRQVLDIQKGFDTVALHNVVDRRIVRIVRDAFSLCFTFDDGQKVKISSLPGEFESGHIWHAGELQVF